jgi:hypothetical protein
LAPSANSAAVLPFSGEIILFFSKRKKTYLSPGGRYIFQSHLNIWGYNDLILLTDSSPGSIPEKTEANDARGL